MIVTSGIGFLNSCVVMNRNASHNTGKNITTWLLLDSLFETTRVVYVFVCEILLKGKGPMQLYELLISAAQYREYSLILTAGTTSSQGESLPQNLPYVLFLIPQLSPSGTYVPYLILSSL